MIIFQFCSLFFSSNTTYWNLECTGSAYAIAPHLNFLEFSSDAAKVFLRTTSLIPLCKITGFKTVCIVMKELQDVCPVLHTSHALITALQVIT